MTPPWNWIVTCLTSRILKQICMTHNLWLNPFYVMKENQLEIKMAILLDGIMLTHYWIVELSANIVTEAIFNQVDDDAYDLSIFKEIIGHECDKTALTIDERNTLIIYKLIIQSGVVTISILCIWPEGGRYVSSGKMAQYPGLLWLTLRIPFQYIWPNMPLKIIYNIIQHFHGQ